MKPFWKYVFPLLFGIMIYVTIRLVNDLTAGEVFWERQGYTTTIEVFFVILTSYVIQFMVNWHIRKFSAERSKPINSRRILREFATIYAWLFVIINVILIPMVALTDDGLGLNDFVIAHIIPGLYVLLYFAIVRGNIYLQDFVAQRLQLEKIENNQLQTELKFLKAQYHPHFLFNALNTIYFQMDENVAAAKKSVEKFSELLRYQLYDQQQTVPIAQEIEYLKSFISLQQVRSSEKLLLNINFDPELSAQTVYPLLFLPLVENAFKYVGGEYHLRISASWQRPTIVFSVENSIPGYLPVKEHKGIGLENLRRRLELLYPSKHSLEIKEAVNKFTAILTITTTNTP